MKRFFITVLCVSLFGSVNCVWASGDDQQDKAPVKKENVDKKQSCDPKACPATAGSAEKKACDPKADASKACCAEKKNCDPKACEAKACCAEKKDGCDPKTCEKACCKEKKDGCAAKAGGTKACCDKKETSPKAVASCTNTEATKETTSSGKK